MPEAMSPEFLVLFFFATVPGIVALFFRAQFMAGRMPAASEGLISYVTVSLAYQAFAWPIAAPLYAAGEVTGWYWLGWIALVFIGPAIVGVLLGLNIRKGWGRKLVGKLGITTVHPVNCAWDWRFSQCEECWVIVTLKNDTQWFGYLGPNSFMSTDPGERDLFIEHVYERRKQGKPWKPMGSSVWIAHGEIQSLEFLPRQ